MYYSEEGKKETKKTKLPSTEQKLTLCIFDALWFLK